MKHKLKKLMAYIYMPLIFTVIGCGFIFLALLPYIGTAANIAALVTSESTPTFHTQLDSIYQAPPVSLEEQPETVPVSVVQWPAYGEQYGVLSCERIQLNTPVYFGDSKEILREGAGQYIGTFLPGYNRLILLAGHNTTYFKPLQIVEVGDIFTFSTSYGIYQYEVIDTRIADHNDSSAYDLLMEEEMLIMYTCYPFETLAGTKTDRLFVYAKRIAGPDVVE